VDFDLQSIVKALQGRPVSNGPSMAADYSDTLRAVLPGYGVDTRSAQAQALRQQVRQQAYDIGMSIGPSAIAYHGSPHNFDKFQMEKVGTGEGAQTYGHGLYFAEKPSVAQSYQFGLGGLDTTQTASGVKMRGRVPEMLQEAYDQAVAQHGKLSPISAQDAGEVVRQKLNREAADALKAGDMNWFGKVSDALSDVSRYIENAPKPKGSLYKVDIPDEAIGKMLDWDKPLSQQGVDSKSIISYINKRAAEQGRGKLASPDMTGEQAHRILTSMLPSEDRVSQKLAEFGIPGIKYLDQGSRAAGKGTYNYVVFDENLPKILGKE
jgi:hypothetical protein